MLHLLVASTCDFSWLCNGLSTKHSESPCIPSHTKSLAANPPAADSPLGSGSRTVSHLPMNLVPVHLTNTPCLFAKEPLFITSIIGPLLSGPLALDSFSPQQSPLLGLAGRGEAVARYLPATIVSGRGFASILLDISKIGPRLRTDVRDCYKSQRTSAVRDACLANVFNVLAS